MPDDDFENVASLASDFDESFRWECVETEAKPNQVLKAICTCALLLGRLTNSTGDVYVESDKVGRAASAGEVAAIEDWIIRDPWHYEILEHDDRISVIQCILRALAQFFDRHHLVR